MYWVKKEKITYNGRVYTRGEKLSHRTGIRDQQLIKAMLRMGKITKTPPTVETVKTEAPVAPPVPTPAPETPTPYDIKHKGGGYYEVVMNNVVLSEGITLKGEEAAEQWALDNV